MRIALAPINPTIGDLAGNVERCLDAIATARGQMADLIVLPELAIPGYPPRDILFDPSFSEAVQAATADLARRAASGPPVIVGSLAPAEQQPPDHPGLYNAALLLTHGKTTLVAAKRLLPDYDVFFESRWFVPGPALPPVTINGRQIGVLICEDVWDEGYNLHPPAELQAAGAELLICLSASPYRRGVLAERLYHARRQACPLLYVNLCGANDELIFDGRSFTLNRQGDIVAQLAGFEEAVQTIDLNQLESRPADLANMSEGKTELLNHTHESPEAALFQALVLGIRDFARKTGWRGPFWVYPGESTRQWWLFWPPRRWDRRR